MHTQCLSFLLPVCGMKVAEGQMGEGEAGSTDWHYADAGLFAYRMVR